MKHIDLQESHYSSRPKKHTQNHMTVHRCIKSSRKPYQSLDRGYRALHKRKPSSDFVIHLAPSHMHKRQWGTGKSQRTTTHCCLASYSRNFSSHEFSNFFPRSRQLIGKSVSSDLEGVPNWSMIHAARWLFIHGSCMGRRELRVQVPNKG